MFQPAETSQLPEQGSSQGQVEASDRQQHGIRTFLNADWLQTEKPSAKGITCFTTIPLYEK